MKVIAKTEFLHGRCRLMKDGFYEVPDRLGWYFVVNGWAREPESDELQGDFEILSADVFDSDAPAKRGYELQTLEIQDVGHINAADILGG